MSFKKAVRHGTAKTIHLLLSLPGKWFHQRSSLILRDALSMSGTAKVLMEEIQNVPTARGDIRFYCLGELAVWRAKTLLTKEPETIEWIDQIQDGDVLWDIGANVGSYSIYAGINRKVRVLSFEPSSANYYLLNRNIEVNNLSHQVTAYCIAFTDADMISDLHMQTTEFAGALSSFHTPVDGDGETFEACYLQGMLGYSVDGFIEKFSPDFPNHMKIDVDGIEEKVIAGALKTLADTRMKSLSIELDAERKTYSEAVISQIESCGLTLVCKRHAEMFDDGQYANIYNYQFSREA